MLVAYIRNSIWKLFMMSPRCTSIVKSTNGSCLNFKNSISNTLGDALRCHVSKKDNTSNATSAAMCHSEAMCIVCAMLIFFVSKRQKLDKKT